MKFVQIDRHPLSKLWPDIPDGQFAELRTDIEKHGQRYPIIIYDGQILDGWHRYKACTELKVKPKTEKFKGSPQAAKELVDSLNAHRRNVSESQRAFAVVGGNEWVAGQSRGVARATPVSESDGKSKTNEEMSAIAGVSQDTIIRAKKVHKSGSKALKEAVQAGEVSVNKAAAVVDLPKREQLKAATQKPTPVPAEPERPDDVDEDAALESAERELAESIDKVMRADDKSAAMHDEIKRQAAEIAVLKISRDGFMNGKDEITRLLKQRDREVSRLKKELTAKDAEIEKLHERIAIMSEAA